MTKGSVDRTAIAAIMDGRFDIRHEAHEYTEPTSKPSHSSNHNDTDYNAVWAEPSSALKSIAYSQRYNDYVLDGMD